MNETMFNSKEFAAILMVIFGCISFLCFLFPRIAWFLKMGWSFRDKTEPSMLWLITNRISGLLSAAICFGIAAHLYDPETTEKYFKEIMSHLTTQNIQSINNH